MYPKMYGNLHFHSTHSDGVDTPADLIKIAKKEGYKALALTDHDTITGVEDFVKACENEGVEYIKGAEFSAAGNDEYPYFHIVGFDFDIENPLIKEHFEYMSKRTLYRTKWLFDRGVSRGTLTGIAWDEVVEDNPGITFLCVDHVFSTMKKKGIITDAGYTKFVQENFTGKIPFKNIYEDKSVKEIISLINAAGGVAIFAHPGFNGLKYVPEMVEWGLKGIETWHASRSDEEAIETEKIAKKYNLYESGGTDHRGLMGGQYAFYEGKSENPFYVPPLKHGVSEENFRKIKERVYG